MNRRSFLKLFPAVAALHPALAIADDKDVREVMEELHPSIASTKNYVIGGAVVQLSGPAPMMAVLLQDDRPIMHMPIFMVNVPQHFPLWSMTSVPVVEAGAPLRVQCAAPVMAWIDVVEEPVQTLLDLGRQESKRLFLFGGDI